MPDYPAFAFKLAGDQPQPVVSATRSGAGMTSVKGGFIVQLTLHRSKSCIEPLQDALLAVAHSESLRYLDNIRLCAMMNANINPVKPKSLKLTQVAVSKL